jgi:hypothetical protein
MNQRWQTWREAHPADARRLLRGGALSVLVLLAILMIAYPHGLYVLGVVTAIMVVIGLLYADWKA